MARYAKIQVAIDAEVYFCDPHSPWQRGTNENTNRLLRHWFAKSTDLSVPTAQDLKRVQESLNSRPRPTLGCPSMRRDPAHDRRDLVLPGVYAPIPLIFRRSLSGATRWQIRSPLAKNSPVQVWHRLLRPRHRPWGSGRRPVHNCCRRRLRRPEWLKHLRRGSQAGGRASSSGSRRAGVRSQPRVRNHPSIRADGRPRGA
jgi:hypothetical protein